MRHQKVVVVVCLIALSLAGQSQAEEPLRWRKGLLFNVNIARIDGGIWSELYGGFDNRTTLGGGAFALYLLSESFALQTEVRYAPRGAKDHYAMFDSEGNDLGTGTRTWKLNYIDVPILARVYVPTGSRLRPLFYAGPNLAFNISSTFEDSGTGQNVKLDEDIANFDFGIAFGGGLEFGAGRGRLILDARYILGLSKIFTGVAASEEKNRVLAFGLGYAF